MRDIPTARAKALDFSSLPTIGMADAKETARQQAVDAFRLVDALDATAYDDFTALAAAICGTPVALLSIVDGNRQWFRSKFGTDLKETPRSMSFCAHAIVLPDPVTVVPDATQDARFRDNPLVTGSPHIRFYAGAPLVMPSGHAIGALCVIDSQARSLTPTQLTGLEVLSRQIVAQLEMRRLVGALATSNVSLSYDSVTDALTGVPNRRALEYRLLEEFSRARRNGTGLALLMIDIDHFKPFNDEFGHQAGDEALHRVAQIMQASRREYDFLARYGGEEFALILPNTGLDEAKTVAERLREAIAAAECPYRSLTVSIGAAGLGPACDIEALIANADLALYAAKASGRNRVAG